MKDRIYSGSLWTLMLAGLAVPLLVTYGMGLPAEVRGPVTQATFTMFEQGVISLAAFVVKPLYQLLSLIIAIMLWKRTEPDLAALRRAVLAFLIGENACAANYLFFHDQSVLMETLHAYGMALCFGLSVYAGLEALDKRILHYSERDKKCTLLQQCGRCYKYSRIDCTLRHLFLFIIPATALLAAVPLTAVLGNHLSAGTVFGSNVVFGQPMVYQIMEARVYPLLSLIPFIISFFLLVRRRENAFELSKIFYALGVGPLGFALMRFFFYWGYRQNPLWADAWEEITELLFIALVLWIVLRMRALSNQPTTEQ